MIPFKIKQNTLAGKALSFLSLLGIALILLALSGCGKGLPDDIKKNAKALPKAIEAAQKDIKISRAQFASLKKSAEFQPIASYAQKENWDQMFEKAEGTLARANDLYKKDLAPLVKKNKPDLAPQVLVQTKRITQVIQESRQLAKGPVNRFSRIREAMDNTDDIQKEAESNQGKIAAMVAGLATGPVAKAREQFPDAVPEIDARFAPFLKIQQDTKTRFQTIEKEYFAHKSRGKADYAVLIDNVDALSHDFKTLEHTRPVFEQDLGQLYESYTKVLQDMRQDFFVTIKRESWDENSDYYNPRFATFQRQVSPLVYKSLVESDSKTIAAITPGFTGSKFANKIGNTWKELAINPGENWPARNHNAASFWVEDAREVYYHRYLKEENGETSETDWVKVDPSFYEQNLEFLGMAILSKPYGVFEKDRLTQATPPGMAYVGNSKYGEWKKDEQGTSFWSWYGRYAFFSSMFFFPPSYFHYGSWNRWNNNYRNRQPYFGKNQNGAQHYGTRGSFVKQSPRFQASNFLKTGGLKSQAASVRGAGSKLRSGGPKAKGK
ncbi:MAG: hypothetical protein B6230_02695 [Desulfobacteraceae bacterium 4572_89]|nr:MAG: hypothetical protein B6230_02695 [Desulfobacteraceae bacterium 4572_89]